MTDLPLEQQCELISWAEVARLSYRLARQIRASGYLPDIVIAIARGGYVPARMVCDYLDLFELTSIRIIHYTVAAERAASARLAMPLAVNIENRKVLLVDDVSDSGATLELALPHLAAANPAQVKVAVLHHKIVSPYVPDYYAKKVIKWRWLIYPWAITEDVSTFIQQMQPRPQDIAQIQTRLLQQYRIKVNTQQIEAAMQVVQQREHTRT